MAREWYAVGTDGWAKSYGDKIIARFENDVFRWIGKLPVAEVTAPQLLEVMRRIEARGVVETAHRALQDCSQALRYPVATGKAPSNPARDLKGALRRPTTKHFPAITEPTRLGALLRAIDDYAATPVVEACADAAAAPRRTALRRMGGDRPGRRALDRAVDAYEARASSEAARPAAPGAAVTPGGRVLRDLQPLTGNGPLVFRGECHHDRPMSDNIANAALRAMGFSTDEVTGHGFRATARTMLHERLGFDPNVIEAQLAHSVQDALGRAYNRAEFLEQRWKMMPAGAGYLDKLRKAPPETAGAKR